VRLDPVEEGEPFEQLAQRVAGDRHVDAPERRPTDYEEVHRPAV
jgi:hypothetical protein